MSKRVFDPAPGAPAMTKAEKRDAARAARARLAAAARRRALAKNIVVGLAVIGVVVAGFYLVKDSFDAAPTATPTANPTPTAATDTPTAPFPPVPADANPALKIKPVVEPPTGTVTSLKVTTLIEGTGAAATAGKQVTVNYVGVSFKDGKEFDASWNKSQAFPFTLGQGGVIPGWDQGLVGVKVGSRVQLDIPAAMAYTDNPTGGRPGGALRFVVDVLAVG